MNRTFASVVLAAGFVLASPLANAVAIETHKLIASDRSAGDVFGDSNSVDVSGNKVVVGGFQHDGSAGSDSGQVYLFNANTGTQTHTPLVSNDIAAGDRFGISVAISGNVVVVGADQDDVNGADSGSAYLFNATTGQQTHKLNASDAAFNDKFGNKVDIDGDRVIIGAHQDDVGGADGGSAYIFDATTGQQLHKLTASDAAFNDHFGLAVAIDGNFAVVGAQQNDDDGADSGSAYIFDVTTGQELHKLTASNGAFNDKFGNEVAISGNLVAVGAHKTDRDPNDATEDFGSVYLFDATTGQELAIIEAPDEAAGDEFGASVALNGNLLVVGSRFDSNANGSSAGAVYLFNATTGELLDKMLASDGTNADILGSSIALDGNFMVAGAPNDDALAGAAYVLEVSDFNNQVGNVITPATLPLMGLAFAGLAWRRRKS